MQSRTKVLTLAILIPAWLLTYNIAQACRIGGFSAKEEFNEADAVFVGKLVRHTEERREHSSTRGICTYYTYHFQVIRAWKGVSAATIDTRAFYDCEQRSICDHYFEERFLEGQAYLVYGYLHEDEGALYAYLEPGGMSKHLAKASEDLEQLPSTEQTNEQAGMPQAGAADTGWIPIGLVGLALAIGGLAVRRYWHAAKCG